MLLILNDNKSTMEKDNFLNVINYIRNAGSFESIPVHLEDVNGLQNNPDIQFFVKKIREVDREGFFPIFFNHTCNHFITDDWVKELNVFYDAYPNIHINIYLTTDSNVDNIRNLLKELYLARNTFFNFIIDRNDFDITRCINLMTEYTANNRLNLILDHTKKLDHKIIADRLCTFTEKRKRSIIALDFDCGFPLCMFTNEQIGELFKSPLMGFRFFCSPDVVIHPDEKASFCKLSPIKLEIKNTSSYKDLNEQLIVLHEEDTILFSEECTTCWPNNRLCSGGCKFRNK